MRSNCEACGGVYRYCFPGVCHTPNVTPSVMVVTPTPIYKQKTLFQQLAGYLSQHQLDLNNVFWTSVVKCVGKRNYSKTSKYCIEILKEEIATLRPQLIITIGKDVLLALYGQNKAAESKRIIKVNTIEVEDHTAFHLHAYSLDDLAKNPTKKADNDFSLSKIQAVLQGLYPRNPFTDKLYLVATRKHEIQSWMDRYAGLEYLSFDIETGGTHPEYNLGVGVDPYSNHSYIIGAQISGYPGEAVFVDFRPFEDETILWFLNWTKNFKLIMQNGKFDCNYIRYKYGVDLFPNFSFDTMLADHLLREFDKRHNLKFMVAKHYPEFDEYEKPLTEFFDKVSDEKIDFGLLPPELLYPYGCIDADATLRLGTDLDRELKEENIPPWLVDHVMRMQRSYAEREYYGWGIDLEAWKKIRDEAHQIKADQLRNLQSHHVWNKYVYRVEADFRAEHKAFWLPSNDYTEENKTGEIYTDSQCLEVAEPKIITPDGKRKNRKTAKGTRVVANTYTTEDLIPDPSKDTFKRQVLYGSEFFNLPVRRETKGGQDGKNKKPSVDQQTLRELKGDHKNRKDVVEFLSSLEELERVTKQITTYITPVFPHEKDGKIVDGWLCDDGLVHPTYMLAGHDYGSGFLEGGTTSGRISCARPNLTNIPTRRGGKKIKKMFVPKPRNTWGQLIEDNEPWYFIQLDYSQLELRVLADLSGDPFMVSAYNSGQDLHTNLACQQNNKELDWFNERLKNDDHPEHELAFNLRLCAKTSWFSVIYGAGPSNLKDTLADYGLLIDLDTAKKYVYDLERTVVLVAQLKSKVIANAPICINPFYRRRVVLDCFSVDPDIRAKAQRQLFNFLIQSTGSDTASRGIYLSDEWLRNQKQEHGLRSYPVGAVHDSNILACPASEVDYVAWNIKRIMEDPDLPWEWKVPRKVDVEYGLNWGELRNWEPGKVAVTV